MLLSLLVKSTLIFIHSKKHLNKDIFRSDSSYEEFITSNKNILRSNNERKNSFLLCELYAAYIGSTIIIKSNKNSTSRKE